MAFVVEVTPRAESDIRDAYSYIREFAPEAAERWARGIRPAIARGDADALRSSA
jgi:plasmid stabilization system protein ParE